MCVLPILLASYLPAVFGRIESELGPLMSMDEHLHRAWPPGLDDKYRRGLQTRIQANPIYLFSDLKRSTLALALYSIVFQRHWKRLGPKPS